MAITDSRRLNMVIPYLYPNLKNTYGKPGAEGDYYLRDDSDGTGSYVVWLNKSIPEPTAQAIADAKEAGVNAYWFEYLREIRTGLLAESDWSQGADVPSGLKSSYATYRQELRDLPATVTKPAFSVLNTQTINEWNLESLMPTKPS